MAASLHGKKVLITREENQAKVFSEKVLQCGGTPIEIPLIKISCKSCIQNNQLVRNLHQYKWIFFTSANGVNCFFELLKRNGIPNKSLKCQVAAVGHKTAEALQQYGVPADFIPSAYNADVMSREFLIAYPTADRVLFVRGNRSRDVLPDVFLKKNIRFDMIEVYETDYNYQSAVRLNDILLETDFDFITFTSPSTVEAFINLMNDADCIEKAKKTICVCIGTTTEQKANEMGFNNTIIPNHFTIDDMLAAMTDYIKKG
ncbi:uroporphyrinogen-III synthase [Virgibacillus oceani]|uniref:Uroporphyrinogen-III synthase n=1 Tax=Virgibacillus oceani TaxID=1479511 RepID=A0A917LWV5_9BACI|nr:uroporphyrinogen-III synthase [Virgibacillus oceani]GGG62387.1 uroporphyrinogen-III synthase [Virgibacillus oceani]